MRTLTLSELQAVSGAGFEQDIGTLAASILVANTIRGFATGAAFGVGSALVTVASVAGPSAAFAVGAMTSVAAPVVGLAAPFILGAMILERNPSYQDALVDKFHAYFG